MQISNIGSCFQTRHTCDIPLSLLHQLLMSLRKPDTKVDQNSYTCVQYLQVSHRCFTSLRLLTLCTIVLTGAVPRPTPAKLSRKIEI